MDEAVGHVLRRSRIDTAHFSGTPFFFTAHMVDHLIRHGTKVMQAAPLGNALQALKQFGCSLPSRRGIRGTVLSDQLVSPLEPSFKISSARTKSFFGRRPARTRSTIVRQKTDQRSAPLRRSPNSIHDTCNPACRASGSAPRHETRHLSHANTTDLGVRAYSS